MTSLTAINQVIMSINFDLKTDVEYVNKKIIFA